MAAFLQWRMSEATAEARPAMASGYSSVLRVVRARGKQMGQAVCSGRHWPSSGARTRDVETSVAHAHHAVITS